MKLDETRLEMETIPYIIESGMNIEKMRDSFCGVTKNPIGPLTLKLEI